MTSHTTKAPPSSKRVLLDLVATRAPLWGGMEEHVCALGRTMPSLGYECLFMPRVEYPPPLLRRMTDAGVRLVDEPEVLVRGDVDPSPLRWTSALGRLLRRERVDIYHIHSNVRGKEHLSTLAARVAGVRALVCSYHTLMGQD